MAKGETGKGGGARKIGRNRTKCERYRFRQKGKTMEGRHQHKAKSFVSPSPGYIDRLALIPEDKYERSHPRFVPVAACEHLATEYYETGKRHRHMEKGDRLIEDAKNIARPIRRDRRCEEVLHMPKRKVT